MGAKSQVLAEDFLQAALDGTDMTGIVTSAIRARLGTGITSVTNQLTGYSTELGEAAFQSASATPGANWTIGATASTGKDATNDLTLGNGSSEWHNSTGSTISPTHIALYKVAASGTVGNLLYAGALDGTPEVGADAVATIAISGLVIGEL
jgi:hypothetical protein